MSTYEASLIAEWFIAFAEYNDSKITKLQLQKLMYNAQGHYLVEHDIPLFDGKIKAWRLGPVVFEVASIQFAGKDDELILASDTDFYWERVNADDTRFLIKMWHAYGNIDGWALMVMSHDDDPWANVYIPNDETIDIDNQSIKAHFAAALSYDKIPA